MQLKIKGLDATQEEKKQYAALKAALFAEC